MSPNIEIPKLEVNLPFGPVRKFNTLDEAQAFVNSERDFFNRFNPRVPNAPNIGHANQQWHEVSQLFVRMDRLLSTAREIIERASREPEQRRQPYSDQIVNHAREFVSTVETTYNTGAMVLSNSPAGEFLTAIAQSSPHEAAFALLHLLGRRFETEEPQSRTGFFKALLFQSSISVEGAKAAETSFNELTNRLAADMAVRTEKYNEFTNQYDQLVAEQQKTITDAANLRGSHETAFKVFLEGKEAEFNAKLNTTQGELEKLRAAVDQHLKLEAPVKYWRDKKAEHLEKVAVIRKATYWVGGIALLILLGDVAFTFETSKANEIPWRALVAFVVVSSAVFWAVRILVRLLLSAIHLAEDASEREVMALTYMALVRGDDSKATYVSEKDRALVLAPLFRPSSTGIVSDDGAPAQLADIVAKLARK